MLSLSTPWAVRSVGVGPSTFKTGAAYAMPVDNLGVVPAEWDLAKVFQYRPVHTAWIDGDFITPNWARTIATPAGLWTDRGALGNPDVEARIQTLEATQRRALFWQRFSALGVLTLATVAVIGMIRDWR